MAEVATINIACSKLASLNNFVNTGRYIHGSCMLGDYVYGSDRETEQGYNNGCIVKAPISNVLDFSLFPITVDTNGRKAFCMDSMVSIGSKLYTISENIIGSLDLVIFDTLTDTYQVFRVPGFSAFGAPSCTDGTYLYYYSGSDLNEQGGINGVVRMTKLDPSIFVSNNQLNIDTIWGEDSLQYIIFYTDSYQFWPHSMVVDSEFLYVGMGTGFTYANSPFHEVQKINKTTMTFDSRAHIPKATDDMCQTDTHVFLGVEESFDTAWGYDMGACAVRKSDMAVILLPKLHSSDTLGTVSYASLIFGNYLIELKTNKHIYVLDITDVDNWLLTEEVGLRTLKDYRICKPAGTVILDRPINEVFLTADGKFIGFGWGVISDIAEFELTGLDYFAVPTVVTGSALVNGTTATLPGSIVNNGGRILLNGGITLGSQPDLSDGIDFPNDPITIEFEQIFNNLELGTYYFRVYSSNAIGAGYGSIETFIITVMPDPPTGLASSLTVEVQLSWTAAINDGNGVLGYKIERKLVDGTWSTLVADTGNQLLTYLDTVPVGNYVYRISTLDGINESLPSEEFSVIIGSGNTETYKIYIGELLVATLTVGGGSTRKTYWVEYYDWNETLLKRQEVLENGDVIQPVNPSRESYLFSGWDLSSLNVQSDLVIHAQYDYAPNIVAFSDYLGNIIDVQYVATGGNAIPPVIDWGNVILDSWQDYTNIQGNKVITPNVTTLNNKTYLYQTLGSGALTPTWYYWLGSDGNATINHGDGTTAVGWALGSDSHLYATAGDYIVSFEAYLPTWVNGWLGDNSHPVLINGYEHGLKKCYMGLINANGQTFSGCHNMTEVLLANMSTLPGGLFYDCTSLASIIIPSSVTRISSTVFSGCTSLKKYILKSDTVVVLDNIDAFLGLPIDAKFYVPASLVNDYKIDSQWSSFSDKIFSIDTLAV